ncbi:MAG TPA: pyridoxal-dependent decarboxylase [Longimicrobiales bacterium]|nr:pyridoxal-dependent decarboxylase [Longimicrobiales bacterium]
MLNDRGDMAEGNVGSPDMTAAEFREHGRAVIDRIADYLAHPENVAVLPDIQPGDVASALPTEAPERPEPFERILDDYDRLIVPGTTHWNHPGFFAYFAITGSAPGILGEALAAALNVNAMLWRTGPAQTELEAVTLDWLRQLLGLPEGFHGVINDTASSSTLYALAAAREAAGLDVRARGLAGRGDLPRLRVYCSEEAHSSVDKAVITLGLGAENVVRIPTDEEFRMVPEILRRAVRQDVARGYRPLAVVATVGTTGVTAVDPVPEIAEVCRQERLWLHVDAAYGGTAAIMPEMRHVLAGCERADSLVVNPHKWMFVPIDCSAAYTRHPDVMRQAFSLTPEYLKTGADATNLMDFGVSLGRRFRALKLWFVLRYFGRSGIADALREHCRLARLFAGWVDADDRFTRVAPVPFSVVTFRAASSGLSDEEADAYNQRVLEWVNGSGEVFLSHTRVRGRFVLRLAVGNLRTRETHVARAWDLLREAAEAERP